MRASLGRRTWVGLVIAGVLAVGACQPSVEPDRVKALEDRLAQAEAEARSATERAQKAEEAVQRAVQHAEAAEAAAQTAAERADEAVRTAEAVFEKNISK